MGEAVGLAMEDDGDNPVVQNTNEDEVEVCEECDGNGWIYIVLDNISIPCPKCEAGEENG